jgi:hypothetical protein
MAQEQKREATPTAEEDIRRILSLPAQIVVRKIRKSFEFCEKVPTFATLEKLITNLINNCV